MTDQTLETPSGANTLVVIRRGSEDGSVPQAEYKFRISNRNKAQAILRHPSLAGWRFGLIVSYENTDWNNK